MGDVQGCDDALARLLAEIAFSPSRDQLVLLGDLVNRGPDSAGVLRRVRALDGAVQCVLGNHDLHLLAVAHGARPRGRQDTLDALLAADDAPALLDWLRRQPLALHRRVGGADLLMVHAGVLPAWSVPQTLALAAEVQAALQAPEPGRFLQHMYGNRPDRWDDTLAGIERLRVAVNALTRLRFVTPEGAMDFDTKEGADAAPPGHLPWFDVPGRRTAHATVACGHWSTLGWLSRPDLIATDTGCVWGGCLTAVRLGATPAERERIQVRCVQAQRPG